MPRKASQEIISPETSKPAGVVIRAPIVYQEYPKTLEHPKGEGNRFPPVIVNDESQEQYYLARGYEAPGKGDPYGFLTAKATEKTDDAVRLMNEKFTKAMASVRSKARKEIDEVVREATEQIDATMTAQSDRITRLEVRFQGVIESNIKLQEQVHAALNRRPWWKFWSK